LLAGRMQRSSPVVALGGGIVGDVAGFAAATYLRGVPVVQVPTTLLAMVDAAIGGKTGVNHPLPAGSGLGKNLIGAFWQPSAVLADPEVLRTLDERHLRCGLAECIKHGVIAEPGLFELIEQRVDELRVDAVALLEELVLRAAAVKATIVARDVRESGVRALLNLGHTFAHVIEPIADLDLHHGEAVSIGMCAAARCAERTGRLGAADRERIEGLLAQAALPVRLSRPVPAGRLIAAMMFDKKVAKDRLRLVLPTAIGAATVVDDVPRAVIDAAWSDVGAGTS
ncbi:MAG: 3-dehydroquinate synthase, partial [Planctomycetota bacterium]